MIITIGLYSYLLVTSCLGAGAVGYPQDDNNKEMQRTIVVCTEYGPEQAEQIYVHETIHACIHNHPHHFKTQEELANHLKDIDKQSEELFVANLAACVVPVLENEDAIEFLGIKPQRNNRSSSGPVFSTAGQTLTPDKRRYRSKSYGVRKNSVNEKD